jgi:hypothetical protein
LSFRLSGGGRDEVGAARGACFHVRLAAAGSVGKHFQRDGAHAHLLLMDFSAAAPSIAPGFCMTCAPRPFWHPALGLIGMVLSQATSLRSVNARAIAL